MTSSKGSTARGARKLTRAVKSRRATDKVVKPSKPATIQSRAPAAKRPARAKEVIPFRWKLIGEASGLALTLFKAVEREDVEAQLERLSRDGYYRKLRILEIDEKVKQPSSAQSRRMARKRVKTKTAAKSAKRKRAMSKAGKSKRRTKTSIFSRPTRKVKAAKTSKGRATAPKKTPKR